MSVPPIMVMDAARVNSIPASREAISNNAVLPTKKATRRARLRKERLIAAADEDMDQKRKAGCGHHEGKEKRQVK